jgi:hypothetical protein
MGAGFDLRRRFLDPFGREVRRCLGPHCDVSCRRLGAADQQFLKPPDLAFQVVGNRCAACGERHVGVVDFAGKRGSHRVATCRYGSGGEFLEIGGPPGQIFEQFAAVGPYGAVEFGKMPGDEVAELGGIARDALGKLGAVA